MSTRELRNRELQTNFGADAVFSQSAVAFDPRGSLIGESLSRRLSTHSMSRMLQGRRGRLRSSLRSEDEEERRRAKYSVRVSRPKRGSAARSESVRVILTFYRRPGRVLRRDNSVSRPPSFIATIRRSHLFPGSAGPPSESGPSRVSRSAVSPGATSRVAFGDTVGRASRGGLLLLLLDGGRASRITLVLNRAGPPFNARPGELS